MVERADTARRRDTTGVRAIPISGLASRAVVDGYRDRVAKGDACRSTHPIFPA
jgi:hypothetical protein